MRLKTLFLLLFFTCASAHACNNDYQCGYGNKCIKAIGDTGLNGVCVTPVDNYGNRIFNTEQSTQPHEVGGCEFNTDCAIGFSCVKRSGGYPGVCVK